MDSGTIALIIVLAVLIVVIGLAVRRGQRAEPRELRKPEEAPKPQKEIEQGERRVKEPEPEPEEPPEDQEEEEEAPKVVKKPRDEALVLGLAKTRGGFMSRLADLLKGKKTVDAATMSQIEEVLLTADIGVKTSQKLFEAVKEGLTRDALADPDQVWAELRERAREVLETGAEPLDLDRARPLVILVIGVNGVGKTTTIGKLAQKYTAAGKKVLLAAGDTFRAAATEQLDIWGTRTGCPVVKGKEGGDPSSVVFDAVKRAQAEELDIVIGDTAGRLHTKTNLVVDATNGQNAIAQAQMFQQAMQLSGIILTKLDGTAKGGVILGICDELKIPVRYVGVGEKATDLREFDPDAFVDALFTDRN